MGLDMRGSKMRQLTIAGMCSLAGLVSLTACGSSIGSQPLVPGCTQLNGMKVPTTAIGLPTTGAVVTATTLVAASGAGAQATAAYCLVTGVINPVDPAAAPIKFQIAMPASWNTKIMMFGGGGYDGVIHAVSGDVPWPGIPKERSTPLQRGYAVFDSDSGHSAGAAGENDASFAENSNMEELLNYTGDALKKTRDAAIYLIDAHYAVARPSRAYFAGGSTGGREALEVVQRWPQDWDGVLSFYPAWPAATVDLQAGRLTRAFAQSGAYLDQPKRKLLFDTEMATCDALDGVKDGIISNVAACNAIFNPSTVMTPAGTPLRCPGGADTGDTCLSDAQIAALNVYNTPLTLNYPLASGETQYPGANVWAGMDLGMPTDGMTAAQAAVEKTSSVLALGTVDPASPMPANAPYFGVFWDQWVRYFVTQNLSYDSLSLDPQNPGPWQSRISMLSGIQDQNRTDLSAFANHSGKLLMAQGTVDTLVSPRSTEQYYQRLQTTMGATNVDGFVRYYEAPGATHGGIGVAFTPAWDPLTTLENWVEKGVMPAPQIITDLVGVPGRTRPLCEYPEWPRYNDSGDVNQASSFTCVPQ
jgi:hypothetical protein